jgi:hypothetical protein
MAGPTAGRAHGRPGQAGRRSFVAIEKGVGQEAHHAVHAVRIFLFPLVTVLLDLRVVGQGVQPVHLGLIGLRTQRLAVDRDQAGDISLAGFDDVFGGVVVLIGFAKKIAEWAVGSGCVHAILYGTADESRRVYGLVRLGDGWRR